MRGFRKKWVLDGALGRKGPALDAQCPVERENTGAQEHEDEG